VVFPAPPYKRVTDGRYQLDVPDPEVRDHADAVIDTVLKEYGAGYIKIYYNINCAFRNRTRRIS
jgi:DNA-binding cell septation regulator SpoVG